MPERVNQNRSLYAQRACKKQNPYEQILLSVNDVVKQLVPLKTVNDVMVFAT